MIRRITIDDRQTEYLLVDQFLQRLIPSQALQCALDLGLIDLLATERVATSVQLAEASTTRQFAESHHGPLALDVAAVDILFTALTASGVVEHLPEHEDAWQLTCRFRRALRYRDLLEVKLQLALSVAAKLSEDCQLWLTDPDRFCRAAQRSPLTKTAMMGGNTSIRVPCDDATVEPVPMLREQLALSATLTRYESEACLSSFSFHRHQRMLDVGGGSGEFAWQISRRHPDLEAIVVDLPPVCELARQYLAHRQPAHSIRFHGADLRRDDLPEGADLICFKSTLHDWSQKLATTVLTRAVERLESGGRIMIYERAPIPVGRLLNRFHLLPLLLQYRAFRHPDLYVHALRNAGCRVHVQHVPLDTPFFLVTGQK